jgi:predicted DNA-binding protein (UPF0251 family)
MDIDLTPVRYAMRGIRGEFREDVAAAGALAMVIAKQQGKKGQDLLRDVSHACRTADRQEKSYHKRIAFSAPRQIRNDPGREDISIEGAMSILTGRQQRAVWLVFWMGLTHAEAATEMGVSQPVVTLHIQAAIRRLRKYLSAWLLNSPPECVHIVEGKILGSQSTVNRPSGDIQLD